MDAITLCLPLAAGAPLAEVAGLVPDAFILVVAVLVGLMVGSFLNVVIYRMPRNCLSIVRPRSHCPSCQTPIAWYDNLPLFSWALLNGKCRHCKGAISMRYPLVEATTGLLFFLIVWLNVVRPELVHEPYAWLTALAQLVFVCLLVVGGLIDLDLTVIPDRITLGGTVVILAFAAANPWHGGVYVPQEDRIEVQSMVVGPDQPPLELRVPVEYQGKFARVAEQAPGTALHEHVESEHLRSFLGALFGALIAGGAMLVLRTLATGVLLKKALRYGQGAAMGLGDVKLMMLFGAMLGWPGALLSIFGGAALGILVTVPMMMKKGQHLFPFGPFLAASAIVLLLTYGAFLDVLVRFYAPLFV